MISSILFACVLMGFAATASAALVTKSVSFTATGFTPEGGPEDTIIGSFTLTFDNSVQSHVDLPVMNFDMAIEDVFFGDGTATADAFVDVDGSISGVPGVINYEVGGVLNSNNSLVPGSGFDFSLSIFELPGVFSSAFFDYTTPSSARSSVLALSTSASEPARCPCRRQCGCSAAWRPWASSAAAARRLPVYRDTVVVISSC